MSLPAGWSRSQTRAITRANFETMKLPEPKFKVELIEERRKHFYRVTDGNGLDKTYPGVTGFLGIIGGDKTQRLIGWASKTSLERVSSVLMGRLNGEGKKRLTIDQAWVAELMAEARKQPEKARDAAADLGTRAHAWIDRIIKGEAPGTPPEDIAPAVANFERWHKDSGIEFLAGDTKLASLIHEFGGSADGIGYRDLQYLIVDFKTGNYLHPEAALQTGAYAQGALETYGIKASGSVVLRLGKTDINDFEAKEVRCVWTAFEAFLHAKRLAEAMQQEHYITEA